MRLLAADGLVELEPNRGAIVTALRHDDQVAFWEARLALEPAAARLAAERPSTSGVEAMRAAIAEQRSARADDEGFAANRAFHLALVAAAGNPHLDRFAETLWIRTVGQSIYAAQSSDATVVAAYADQHAAMLDAIERGDAELAERLTREHILASPVPEALGTPQT